MACGIGFLYKVLVSGLVVEALLIICGFQPLLAEVLTFSDAPGYKNYNQAEIMIIFGTGRGALNSMLLGSQIAGMLALFSIIWFFYAKKFELRQKEIENQGVWFYLSLAMLVVTVNGTVFLMSILAILIDRLFIWKKHRVALLVSMSCFLVGLYIIISEGYIFSRIFSNELAFTADQLKPYAVYGISQTLKYATVTDYYIYAFLSPVNHWLAAGWVDKLLGVGALYFLNDHVFIGGDFGFAADVLLKAGVVWAVTFVSAVLLICFSSLRFVATGPKELRLWSNLGATNAVISLLWLFSTVHYNQAMQNPGCIMIFALHIAVVKYCYNRSQSFLFSTRNGCSGVKFN